MNVSIIIPAHNEEKRIRRTLTTYHQFCTLLRDDDELDFELVVVLNGCTDQTFAVVNEVRDRLGDIIILDLKQAGKGLAIKAGFEDALTRDNDLIGFVDADMATEPQYFFELIEQIGNYDGIIASRYMPGAKITPERPKIKRWGSWLVYESLIKLLFGIYYYDYQCGAKLFKRNVIETITPHLTVRQWAFDLELLYLCKKYKFRIKELPTVWFDQAGSQLKLSSGFTMLGSVILLRLKYSPFKFLLRK